MSMIRKSSLAAAVLAAALLPLQGASADTGANGQISQIVRALSMNGQFAPNSFTFRLDTGSGSTILFSGIAGVRGFNDFQTLNEWIASNQSATPPANNANQGGSYTFTHSVLGSYFDQIEQQEPAAQAYQAAVAAAPEFVAPPAPTIPVPEPATWAMMIGGLTLAGLALRRSRATVSFV